MNAVAGCTGKSSFPTWSMANAKAKQMNRRKSTQGHMVAYRCKSCSRYHIGRSDPQERRVNKQDRRRFFEEKGGDAIGRC